MVKCVIYEFSEYFWQTAKNDSIFLYNLSIIYVVFYRRLEDALLEAAQHLTFVGHNE